MRFEHPPIYRTKTNEHLPLLFIGEKSPLLFIVYLTILVTSYFALNSLYLGNFVLGLSLFLYSILALVETVFYQLTKRLVINIYTIVTSLFFAHLLAIFELGIVAIYWSFPFMIALTFILPAKGALIFNLTSFVIVTLFGFYSVEFFVAIRAFASLFLTLIFCYLISTHLNSVHEDLHFRAVKDPLTGVFNRTLLFLDLEQAIRNSTRNNKVSTILAIDVDNFKSINDTFGHATGDATLKKIVFAIEQRCREVDRLYRIGGEEFILLMNETNEKDALILAEDIRLGVEREPIISDQVVTISIGVCSIKKGMDAEKWLTMADGLLYEAKKQGKNQIQSAKRIGEQNDRKH